MPKYRCECPGDWDANNEEPIFLMLGSRLHARLRLRLVRKISFKPAAVAIVRKLAGINHEC